MKKYIRPAIRVKEISEEQGILAASDNSFGNKYIKVEIYNDTPIETSSSIGAKHNIWDPEDTEE
ncbi:hypothetical protein [uncultured Prevotella sp.]|uniref:hypothetical protein n=1 Tax=uncultured Prevotella sp. TaxID=159272 RepID=UPI002589E355|nr:hypothetical protein [uncultured Prevotella sp.]